MFFEHMGPGRGDTRYGCVMVYLKIGRRETALEEGRSVHPPNPPIGDRSHLRTTSADDRLVTLFSSVRFRSCGARPGSPERIRRMNNIVHQTDHKIHRRNPWLFQASIRLK